MKVLLLFLVAISWVALTQAVPSPRGRGGGGRFGGSRYSRSRYTRYRSRYRSRRRGGDFDFDDDGGACFTGNSAVHSKWSGDVAMKDLKTGDEILSQCEDGKSCFQPVNLWLHRSDDLGASFLEVTHEVGVIRLTDNHIIFKLDEGNKTTPVWAKSIKVGDKLSLGNKGKTAVLKINEISETGIYSPLVPSGEYFVDGVLVSAFAGIPTIRYNTRKSGPVNRIISGHDIGKLVFSPTSKILGGGFLPSNNPVDGDKHAIAEWMEDTVGNKVLEAFQLDLDDVEEEMMVEAGETSWSAYIIGNIFDKLIGQDIDGK